jgi:hypothetical protein
MFFNHHLVHPDIAILWFSFFVSAVTVVTWLDKLARVLGRYYGRRVYGRLWKTLERQS